MLCGLICLNLAVKSLTIVPSYSINFSGIKSVDQALGKTNSFFPYTYIDLNVVAQSLDICRHILEWCYLLFWYVHQHNMLHYHHLKLFQIHFHLLFPKSQDEDQFLSFLLGYIYVSIIFAFLTDSCPISIIISYYSVQVTVVWFRKPSSWRSSSGSKLI